MKLVIILFMFFVLGALFIVSNSALDFSEGQHKEIFYDSYAGWLGNVFNNVKVVTGNVINMNWLP